MGMCPDLKQWHRNIAVETAPIRVRANTPKQVERSRLSHLCRHSLALFGTTFTPFAVKENLRHCQIHQCVIGQVIPAVFWPTTAVFSPPLGPPSCSSGRIDRIYADEVAFDLAWNRYCLSQGRTPSGTGVLWASVLLVLLDVPL